MLEGSATPEAPQSPPEGWYPDPRHGGQRWWDGTAWTSHRRPESLQRQPSLDGIQAIPGTEPIAPIAATPALRAARTNPRTDLPISASMLGAIAGSALLLGSLLGSWLSTSVGSYNAFARDLPWAGTGGSYDVTGGAITAAADGTFAHGWLLAALAVLAAGCLAVWHQKWAAGLLTAIGGLGALVVVLDLFALRSGLAGLDAGAGIGWGAIAALVGSLAVLGGGVARLVEHADGRG